jgi:DNA polymerase elongation subunit (family B)
MPIHHTTKVRTLEEIDMIVKYCINDVEATKRVLHLSKPLIDVRIKIKEKYDLNCYNYSNTKLGSELLLNLYCEATGKVKKEVKEYRTYRDGIHVSEILFPYIKFETAPFQNFFEKLKTQVIRDTKNDFKYELRFKGYEFHYGAGGIHQCITPGVYLEDDIWIIKDLDVASLYPSIACMNGMYPAHLGKEFLSGYKQMFNKRLELKPLAKKDKRIKGIVGALKLAVNSVYGKSSDMQNWIYDRQLTMFTTITGELSLMMLIEAYELEGIHIISANTDGVTIEIHKEKLEKMFEINEWWQTLTQYELERTDYQKIIFSTVNDYIAIKTDGEIKKKGDFLTDFELHKNKSARIVPMALEQYYVHNIPVESTIRNHINIYDYALRQKASKDFHYEGVKSGKSLSTLTEEELLYNGWIKYEGDSWIKKEWIDQQKPYDRMATSFENAISFVNADLRYKENKTIYNKLIRYYVSNTGEKLLKVKNPECITNAVDVSQVEAGEWVMHVCNFLPKDHPLDNINYEYYIEKAQRIIDKIQLGGKKRKVNIDKNQLSLF